MENTKEYNGWKNYETWKVNLEQVQNDYENYDMFRNLVRQFKKSDSDKENKILAVGAFMKTIIEDRKIYELYITNAVDWLEIAESFYNDEQ